MSKISKLDFERVIIEDFKPQLRKAIKQKGSGSYSSIHEILGLLTEEYHEIIDAVHKKDVKDVKSELIDVAIVALWGVASINQE